MQCQLQDELAKEHAKVFVAASLQADEALGYIVGWLIAGELQVIRQSTAVRVYWS